MKVYLSFLNPILQQIITSLGFVSALAWNEAIQDTLKNTTILNKNSKLIYAIIVSIISLVISGILAYFISYLK